MKLNKTALFTFCVLLSVSACKKIDLSKPVWTPSHVRGEEPKKQNGIPVERTLNQNYKICDSCLLLPKGQEVIKADIEKIRGQLESIHIMGDKVQFQGWAVDVGSSRPVEKILIFANQRLVYEGAAVAERLDVARALGDGGLIRSGFSVVLDKSLFQGLNGKDASISVYAINKDNVGAKLAFKKG